MEATGATLMVATTAVGVFGTLLPDLSDIRRERSTDSSLAHDVACGETVGFLVAVALGAVASALTDSPIPLITGILVSGMLVAIYETVLRTQPRSTEGLR